MAKKAAFGLILAATWGMAQENGPAGLLRGDLVSWAGTPGNGEFTLRTAAARVYSCSYDEKTYMEREKQRITMAGAEKGDRLEVVSDRRTESGVCYTRMVHVLDAPRIYVVPGVRPRPAASNTPALLPRRANLTFTGAVVAVTPDALTVRSRSGEHKLIHLRPDTHYLAEGRETDSGSLRANMLVFVRAGKNLDGEVEAYQVIWGEILHPEE